MLDFVGVTLDRRRNGRGGSEWMWRGVGPKGNGGRGVDGYGLGDGGMRKWRRRQMKSREADASLLFMALIQTC